MPTLVLLGAGASVDAGVPHSNGMTDYFLREADREARSPQFGENETHSSILRFVIGGLYNKHLNDGYLRDPSSIPINIEEVFNALEMLAHRRDIEAAPFLGAWLPAVEDLDRLEIDE